ncbi:hypothetical protein NOVOSPHI9U_260020 [Novosphingobium sp. 9U]|nr:hypothetical protein NOVOSPHI9U_260020 [Novosphingobium sp. 9U]
MGNLLADISVASRQRSKIRENGLDAVLVTLMARYDLYLAHKSGKVWRGHSEQCLHGLMDGCPASAVSLISFVQPFLGTAFCQQIPIGFMCVLLRQREVRPLGLAQGSAHRLKARVCIDEVCQRLCPRVAACLRMRRCMPLHGHNRLRTASSGWPRQRGYAEK